MRSDVKKYTSWDDQMLVSAMQLHSDIYAFEEIYKRHWFRLFGYAKNQLDNDQEAEELIQSLFEKLWVNRQKVNVTNIGAYLAVALRNSLMDVFRKRQSALKFKATLPGEPVSNVTEDDVNRNLLLESIETVLAELPEKTRDVFQQSRYENRSVKEIAGNLDLSEKAVEYHITKAIKLLKQRLKGYLPTIIIFFLIFL